MTQDGTIALSPGLRPGPARLVALASGDFSCNLYWQSVSLILLFFYTDILHLPPATAGLLYMAGALWDGMADLAVGTVLQHRAVRYRSVVAWGSVPLGIAFAMIYRPTPVVAQIFVAQIVFRTFYALVNVPYAAWSVRISTDSRDRAMLAGLRMLFGTAAAILVSLATPAIARATTGNTADATGFFMAGLVFAALGIPILLFVARTAPETLPGHAAEPASSIRACVRVLLANRAFVTLNAAGMASAAAATILNQSVLYYFSHVVGDRPAGSHTLAMMGVAGAVAVPVWMAATGRIGVRTSWFVAAAAGIAATLAFAAGGTGRGAATLYLIAMQIVLTGFNLGFWAMLPDTVEYGEHESGVRVEAMAFGVAALVQKTGLALATGLLGFCYDRIGYTGADRGGTATLAGIRWLMIAGPATGLALSALCMLANPLKRGVHARIVADLDLSASRGD